jgi:hypothetical protein
VKLRILLSFHYYRDTDLDELVAGFPEPPSIFADSGAYSAFSLGGSIDRDEYAAWLLRWERLFDAYANLDVIGDPKGTLVNQQALEAEGLTPLPVFHGNEPWEFLTDYCAAHRYVALGGMVGTTREGVMRWLIEAFRIGEQAGTVFHGFGQTNLAILKAFPWYSVDSTSWASAHRYGQLSLWDDKKARWVKVGLGKHGEVFKHAALVRAHGGDPARLATQHFGLVIPGKTQEELWAEREHAVAVNVVAWLRLEAWLQRRWQGRPSVHLADARPLPSRPDDLAGAAHSIPGVYFADGTTWQPGACWQGLRTYFAEGTQFNLEMLGRATAAL